MTEVTPYPLKTQGFHHFLILLFYGHPAKGGARSLFSLHVEAEIDHVAVLDHVVLALAAQKALLLGGGHAAAGDHLTEIDGLRPDEAPLNIGVDLSGGLGALVPLRMVQARHSSSP